MITRLSSCLIVATIGMTSGSAAAEVVVYTSGVEDELLWEQAVGSWSTIDFTDIPQDEFVTDQYQEQFGVTFGGAGTPFGHESELQFPNDSRGIRLPGGGPYSFDVSFDQPIRAFASDHPGFIRLELFLGDHQVGETIFGGNAGFDRFTGVVSDTPFDRVRVFDADSFAVDDLRFGLVVPGPAGMILLAGMLVGRGRRRA